MAHFWDSFDRPQWTETEVPFKIIVAASEDYDTLNQVGANYPVVITEEKFIVPNVFANNLQFLSEVLASDSSRSAIYEAVSSKFSTTPFNSCYFGNKDGFADPLDYVKETLSQDNTGIELWLKFELPLLTSEEYQTNKAALADFFNKFLPAVVEAGITSNANTVKDLVQVGDNLTK